MFVLKITIVFLLALSAGAEKKIELQDIEEDNLKSENESDDTPEPRSQGGQSSGLIPLDYLKNGFLRFFEPSATPQTRYVQQYAVTEQPEHLSPAPSPKPQYSHHVPQQAMVGYLSNVPMQLYLVPQYYNEQQEQTANAQSAVHYTSATAPQATSYQTAPESVHYSSAAGHQSGAYQTAPEAVQTQTNYIEVPAYVAPTGKSYVQQYSSPVALVSYTPQPTVAPQPTIAPVLAYQVPVVQYQTAAVVAPTSPSKDYYQSGQYSNANSVQEVQEHVDETSSHTEASYHKPPVQEYTRFYSSRTPLRNEYRNNVVSELPRPNPLLLKSPSHLAHIPKTLPMYRPINKPVYAPSAIAPAFTPRPAADHFSIYKRRPTSLLDSYIPSHVQIEYMKRGFAKDPLEAYEALSSGRHLAHSSVIPRHYERGFLPNQMYETPGGGITYGHYKRAPKIDKVQRK